MSLGSSSSEYKKRAGSSLLRSIHIRVFPLDRLGDITFHPQVSNKPISQL